MELVEGVLVYKMAKGKGHTATSAKLTYEIPPLLPAGWRVQVQGPITLVDGEPEPHFTIATADGANRAVGHPSPGEIALVVAIADSSLLRDRGSKLRGYARAGIPTYWIINLTTPVIEASTGPIADAEPPTYADRRDLAETQTLARPEIVGGGDSRRRPAAAGMKSRPLVTAGCPAPDL